MEDTDVTWRGKFVPDAISGNRKSSVADSRQPCIRRTIDDDDDAERRRPRASMLAVEF